MRPRVPRPGIPVIREVDLLRDDEPPTNAEPRSTTRPPTVPEIDERDAMIGKLMASMASLRAAWDVRSREHELFATEVTSVGKCVRELREELADMKDAQGKTSKQISTATRLAPAVIAAIEVGRMVFSHYFPGVGG